MNSECRPNPRVWRSWRAPAGEFERVGEVQEVEGRDPGAAIAAVARGEGTSVIAIPSQGSSSGLKEFVDSVLRATLRAATAAVLIAGPGMLAQRLVIADTQNETSRRDSGPPPR
jgi:hypothetical protein